MNKFYIFFIFFSLLFNINVFADDFDEIEKEIEKLKKEIEILKKSNNKTNNEDVIVSGRIHFSVTTNSNNSLINDKLSDNINLNEYSGLKLTDVRFHLKKNINDNVNFNFSLRANTGFFGIREAYFQYKNNEGFELEIGQLLINLSLENENSFNGYQFDHITKYYTIGDLFYFNGIGFKFSNVFYNYGFYYGIYGNAYNESLKDFNKLAWSFRSYYNPYKEDNNAIHLGFSYYGSVTNYKKDIVPTKIFTNIDEVNLLYSIESFNNLVLEFALNYNSFSIQSEFANGIVMPSDKNYNENFNVNNFYIQFNYILTGEYLNYKNGYFGTNTKVLRPINQGGFGAFELAFRYSRSDLQDEKNNIVFDYGLYNRYSFSLNWLPINNVKFIFEYSKLYQKYKKDYITSIVNNGYSSNSDMYILKCKLYF